MRKMVNSEYRFIRQKIASGMNLKPQFVVIAFLWLFIEQTQLQSRFNVQIFIFIQLLCLFFANIAVVNCRRLSSFVNFVFKKIVYNEKTPSPDIELYFKC